MAETRAAERPLSPHLQIYRRSLPMMMSIVHRITGAGLYVGTLLLAWWLLAAATGPQALALFNDVAGSWFGQLVLFGYTWALIHHMLGGVRHFIWDTGYGLAKSMMNTLARATLIGSITLTILTWIIGYAIKGVL